jgi:hypothetical protein
MLCSRLACVHRAGAWRECMRVQVRTGAGMRVGACVGVQVRMGARRCVGACVRVCMGACAGACAGACVHGGACMGARVRGCAGARVRVRARAGVCMCMRVYVHMRTLPPLKVLGLFFRRVRMVGFSWLFQEFEFVDC